MILDTLAQKRTANTKIVSGNGSDLTDNKLLKGRAKKKAITLSVIKHLLKIAEQKEDTKMTKQLWNTYYCQNEATTTNGRVYTQYCKNRFCTVCAGNRKAELIHKYYPILKTWEDPHFVTLTIRSISAKKLKHYIGAGLIRAFNQIIDKYNKKHKRGRGIKLIGIKSLECNFNPKKEWYNSHFHIIVPNKKVAQILKEEWLKKWTSKHALPDVQDIRRVKNLERDLIETIKYGTKIFTASDPNNKKETSRYIYIKAFYNIISAMQGHRLFGSFGFKLPKEAHIKKNNTQIVNDFSEWTYDLKKSDWVNNKNTETLTGYFPDNLLQTLLKDNINMDSE